MRGVGGRYGRESFCGKQPRTCCLHVADQLPTGLIRLDLHAKIEAEAARVGVGRLFGALVRTHRRRLGLTQSELARLAQVSTRTVGNIETGRIPQPRPDTVRLLAAVFRLHGASLDEL